LWSHPDLPPGPEDLEDPLGFAQGSGQVPDTIEGLDGMDSAGNDESSG